MTRHTFPDQPVLIVDDDQDVLISFEIGLKSAGINNVLTCPDSRNVMELLGKCEVETILLDLSMPHISGEALLPEIVEQYPDVPVIVITAYQEVPTVVRCMKAGAFDYLAKPVDRDLLATTVRRAVHLRRMRDESRHFRESVLDDVLAHPDAFADIITMNRQMRSIFQYIESIAVSPEPVLITGETGVGKELVATAIHRLSGRPGSLVTVNVAGLDDHVFSDTLFGHRKGAFTGAVEYRAGLIEKAEGGTLLLDEIGDLRNETQVKLLRMLQEGEYFPLGADTVQHSDARIIATTNCDVAALQAQGRFRKDLYYRLHAHHIQLPPLRNRLEDIPCLVQHFLQEAAESMGRKVPTIPPDLKTLLQSYRFPGNIRELRAMIYDAVSSHKSHILSLQRFQDHMQDNRESGTLPDNCRARLESAEVPFPTLREANSQLVLAAMKRANGNQSIAARLLGISQPALSARLKKMKTRNPEDKSI